MLMLRLAEPSSWNGHFTIECVPRNETPGSRFSKYRRIASGWKDVIASLSSRTFWSSDRTRSLGFPSSASSKGPCGTLGTYTSCTSPGVPWWSNDGFHLRIGRLEPLGPAMPRFYNPRHLVHLVQPRNV